MPFHGAWLAQAFLLPEPQTTHDDYLCGSCCVRMLPYGLLLHHRCYLNRQGSIGSTLKSTNARSPSCWTSAKASRLTEFQPLFTCRAAASIAPGYLYLHNYHLLHVWNSLAHQPASRIPVLFEGAHGSSSPNAVAPSSKFMVPFSRAFAEQRPMMIGIETRQR